MRSEVGRSEGGKVGRSEGRKVGRLDVGKIGRFEGGKARKNLMEAYTFHNSFLIPSTQKFFIGDLRSPIFHKIYSPGKRRWILDLDTSLKGPRRAEILLHPSETSAAKRSPGGGAVTRHPLYYATVEELV